MTKTQSTSHREGHPRPYSITLKGPLKISKAPFSLSTLFSSSPSSCLRSAHQERRPKEVPGLGPGSSTKTQ